MEGFTIPMRLVPRAEHGAHERESTVLNQALAIANGKGGVGKTSLTANLAAIAANSGWEVLVVDLDPQGNLGADLGYQQLGMGDDGAALSKAVQFGETLRPPVQRVRPHLDAISAGRKTRELAQVLHERGRADSAQAMDAAFAPLVDRYDLVVFDCPPGDASLGDLGLALSRCLVVPIKFDSGSMDGLEVMAARVRAARTSGTNSKLQLLGIVLFDITRNATALRRQVLEELEEDFHQGVRVFETAIRHSQRAAYDMRSDGLVAIEYEQEEEAEREARLELLKIDRHYLSELGPAKSASAQGIADDYTSLTNEILEAFSDPSPIRSAAEIARGDRMARAGAGPR